MVEVLGGELQLGSQDGSPEVWVRKALDAMLEKNELRRQEGAECGMASEVMAFAKPCGWVRIPRGGCQ